MLNYQRVYPTYGGELTIITIRLIPTRPSAGDPTLDDHQGSPKSLQLWPELYQLEILTVTPCIECIIPLK